MTRESLPNRQPHRRAPRARVGTSELSLLEYAGAGIDPESFVAFARLVRPALVERDGAYFLAAHFDEYVQAQWSERLDDVAEVQRVLNRVHVSTFFAQGKGKDKLARAEALRIAELLAEIWTAVFAEIGLRGEVCGEGGDDIGVTLVSTSAAESAAALARVRADSALERDLLAFHDPAA